MESLRFLTCSQTGEGRSRRVAKTRDTIVPEPRAREGREKREGGFEVDTVGGLSDS